MRLEVDPDNSAYLRQQAEVGTEHVGGPEPTVEEDQRFASPRSWYPSSIPLTEVRPVSMSAIQ